jgi:uncharacterized membrane protein YhhN
MRLAIAIASTIVCALALGGLLVAEGAAREDLRAKTKPVASIAFVIVAIALGPSWWILVGLVLGAIGDVLLMYASERAFMAGLVAFLGGHIAYVAAFAQVIPIRDWPNAPLAWIVPPVIAAVIALAWLWRHLGSMRVPVVAYVAVITTMVIGALIVRRPITTAGALLFFASDLSVARDRFVRPGFANRAWGLPAYYAAQLLFAWSVYSSSGLPQY